MVEMNHVTIFVTQSGAVYTIDYLRKTWAREGNKNVRSQGGTFFKISKIKMGQVVQILTPPLTEEASARYICTTPVTQIMEEDPDQEPKTAVKPVTAFAQISKPSEEKHV